MRRIWSRKAERKQVKNTEFLWIIISGISIGSMMGLSNSPVLGSFITPVLGILISALVALTALQSEKDWVPSIRSLGPISLFVASCAIALPLGVFIRTNQLLVLAPTSGAPTRGGAFSTDFSADDCSILIGSTSDEIPIRLGSMIFEDEMLRNILIAASGNEKILRSIVREICSK